MSTDHRSSLQPNAVLTFPSGGRLDWGGDEIPRSGESVWIEGSASQGYYDGRWEVASVTWMVGKKNGPAHDPTGTYAVVMLRGSR